MEVVIEQAEGFPVAILNHNKPAAYLVPAAAFEALLDKLEDVELAAVVKQSEGQAEVGISLDEL